MELIIDEALKQGVEAHKAGQIWDLRLYSKLMAVLHRSCYTLGSVGWFIVCGMSCGH